MNDLERELMQGVVEGPRQTQKKIQRLHREIITTFLIAVVIWVLSILLAVMVKAEEPADTHKFNIRNAESINGFLAWIGLEQITPADAVTIRCYYRGHMPLGIFRRPDGVEGLLCFDPRESVDPKVCQNWGVELVEYDADTVTCRRGGPGTRKSGA